MILHLVQVLTAQKAEKGSTGEGNGREAGNTP